MSAIALSAQLDDLKIITLTDGEEWSARDLMPFAGYDRWENFSKAVNRAIASVNASGLNADDHFRGTTKMVQIGSGARREVEDVQLTRYACYILFQNADGSKPEIAALQQYFAVQTRAAEIAGAPLTDDEIIARALQISTSRVQALESHVAELTPRAEAWDELASAEGDYAVADAAKILARAGIQTGPQRLFADLARFGWVYRGSDGKARAYARAVDDGYLAEKPQSHHHPRTGELVLDVPQVRVTVRGLERLRSRLGGAA
ncbi:MAG TPA: phage antirepressor KilAC domain-containing protein [Microbacterium sp.]|nr:phage antirepressor KilAC domain-containing protein [Microbacterium sp.]